MLSFRPADRCGLTLHTDQLSYLRGSSSPILQLLKLNGRLGTLKKPGFLMTCPPHCVRDTPQDLPGAFPDHPPKQPLFCLTQHSAALRLCIDLGDCLSCALEHEHPMVTGHFSVSRAQSRALHIVGIQRFTE